MSDPYETPEYQQFVDECAKHCRCDDGPCDGVLAGGPCDEIRRGENTLDGSCESYFFDDD